MRDTIKLNRLDCFYIACAVIATITSLFFLEWMTAVWAFGAAGATWRVISLKMSFRRFIERCADLPPGKYDAQLIITPVSGDVIDSKEVH